MGLFKDRLMGLRSRSKFPPIVRRGLSVGLLLIAGSVIYLLLTRLGYVMPFAEIPSVACMKNCEESERYHSVFSTEGTDGPLNQGKSLRSLLTENQSLENISVLVEKSKYRLTLYHDRQPIKAYAIVLGSNPTGDKQYEGDEKTPEGLFRVRDLYPHPQWSKFIWLDYPTPQSWRRYYQRKAQGEIPITKRIGGEIGIHGVPEGNDQLIDQRRNWTWGCVSLKNEHVDEIYPYIQVGTLVEIVP